MLPRCVVVKRLIHVLTRGCSMFGSPLVARALASTGVRVASRSISFGVATVGDTSFSVASFGAAPAFRGGSTTPVIVPRRNACGTKANDEIAAKATIVAVSIFLWDRTRRIMRGILAPPAVARGVLHVRVVNGTLRHTNGARHADESGMFRDAERAAVGVKSGRDFFGIRGVDIVAIGLFWLLLALVSAAARELDPRIPGVPFRLARAALNATMIE